MSTAPVTLAMPVGLPATGADPQVHYTALRPNLQVAVAPDQTVQVWVADVAALSALASMCKGRLRHVPVGAVGPDGMATATSLLLLQPWLWDHLALRGRAPAGSVLPALVVYGNVDVADMTAAIQAELATNPRYQTLGAAERAQAQANFVAGTVALLVTAGVVIGRASVDPAPPAGTSAGARRLDLSFRDRDGGALDPRLYFDLWGLIGGPLVRDHPLPEALRRPVTPALAPIEGGTRVRIDAAGVDATTTVDIGGVAATDVTIDPAGSAIYATVGAHGVGTVDVTLNTPGQPAQSFVGALTYVADLPSAARASALSYAVQLIEVRDRALALDAAGQLTADARNQLRLEVDIAQHTAADAIDQRSAAGGGAPSDPAVGAVWEDMHAQLLGLHEAITAVIG
jgi:hypothetical protein